MSLGKSWNRNQVQRVMRCTRQNGAEKQAHQKLSFNKFKSRLCCTYRDTRQPNPITSQGESSNLSQNTKFPKRGMMVNIIAFKA